MQAEQVESISGPNGTVSASLNNGNRARLRGVSGVTEGQHMRHVLDLRIFSPRVVDLYTEIANAVAIAAPVDLGQ